MELNTIPLILTFLVTGLTVGFGHCIGMCGPIVVSFSLSLQGRPALLPHLFYHCGRALTYMIMGGLMGATGSFAIVAANIETLQKGAMFFTGGLIVIMGLFMSGWIPHARLFNFNYCPSKPMVSAFSKLSRKKSIVVYLPIGLMLGLLPCGPVYTALLAVVRAGMGASSTWQSVFVGSVLMLAFGIGTIPALFLVAKLADVGWIKFRDKIYRLGALLMIGVGIYFIIAAVQY